MTEAIRRTSPQEFAAALAYELEAALAMWQELAAALAHELEAALAMWQAGGDGGGENALVADHRGGGGDLGCSARPQRAVGRRPRADRRA